MYNELPNLNTNILTLGMVYGAFNASIAHMPNYHLWLITLIGHFQRFSVISGILKHSEVTSNKHHKMYKTKVDLLVVISGKYVIHTVTLFFIFCHYGFLPRACARIGRGRLMMSIGEYLLGCLARYSETRGTQLNWPVHDRGEWQGVNLLFERMESKSKASN